MFQPEGVHFCLRMHEGNLRLDPVHVQLVPKSCSPFYPPFSCPCLDHPTSAIILVGVVLQMFQIVFIFSLIPGMIIMNLESKTWVTESALKRELRAEFFTLNHFRSRFAWKTKENHGVVKEIAQKLPKRTEKVTWLVSNRKCPENHIITKIFHGNQGYSK